MSQATLEKNKTETLNTKQHIGVLARIKKLGDDKYRVVVASEALDRHGEKLVLAGLDTKVYMDSNPVVFLNHDYWTTPIAKTTKLSKKDGKLIAEFELNRSHKDYMEIKGSLDDGFYNAASIGFMAFELGSDGISWTKSEMIEWSIVGIPANPEATMLRQLGFTKEVTKVVLAKQEGHKNLLSKEVTQDDTPKEDDPIPDAPEGDEPDAAADDVTPDGEDVETKGNDDETPDTTSDGKDINANGDGSDSDASPDSDDTLDPDKNPNDGEPVDEGDSKEVDTPVQEMLDHAKALSELTKELGDDNVAIKELAKSLQSAIKAMPKSHASNDDEQPLRVTLSKAKGHAQIVHKIAQQIIVDAKALLEKGSEEDE